MHCSTARQLKPNSQGNNYRNDGHWTLPERPWQMVSWRQGTTAWPHRPKHTIILHNTALFDQYFAHSHPPYSRQWWQRRRGLIGKCTVNFLLVLTELFSLGVMDEALRAKINKKLAISHQCDQSDPKFQVEGVAPHQSFLHG